MLVAFLHLVIFTICVSSGIKAQKDKEYRDSDYWAFAAGMWIVFLMQSIIDLLKSFSLI